MYRTVDVKFWTDPNVRFLNKMNKLLFLYCISNPHTHVSGIYYLPKELISIESGLELEEIIKGIDTLSIGNLVLYDDVSSVVWVVNMLKHQPKNVKILKSVAKHLESLHRSPLIPKFLEYYDTLSIPYEYPIDGVSEKSARRTIVTEAVTGTETETDKNTCSSDDEPAPPKKLRSSSTNNFSKSFKLFWSIYPRKQGKQDAFKAWKSATAIFHENDKDKYIIEPLRQTVLFWEKEKTEMRFIPLPATWIRQGRWDDELISKSGQLTETQKIEPELLHPEGTEPIEEYSEEAKEFLRERGAML